ncbi:MAG: GNAT family N-acetyltransferase [Terracidiphilus sp.]|jgi:CelD/BcsL family acetyltransferase involved in cellulose biosynthesis
MTNSLGGNAAVRYSVETVATDAALNVLEADWNRLSETAESPNVFMTCGWFRAWFRQFEKEMPGGRFLPHVLVLKESEAVVGIVPWVRRISSRLFRVRKLEFVTNHADYNEVVLGKDPAGQTEAVVDFLARTTEQWDVVDLRDLRDSGEGTALIESALARAGLLYRALPEKDGCPYLPIDGDAASLMKRLSGHVRRTLRRRRERAETEGLSMRIIENPELEPGLLETLVALDWKKHLHKSSPTFVGTYPDVFKSLFDALGPRGWLYVALLELGGRPIAFQLGFRCGGKLWDYTKAYDRSFSRFAPGTLLLPALLDYGFERGYREYDFLRGEEAYKTVWSAGCHRRFRLLIWNRHGISRMRKFIYHDVKTVIYRLLRKRI